MMNDCKVVLTSGETAGKAAYGIQVEGKFSEIVRTLAIGVARIVMQRATVTGMTEEQEEKLLEDVLYSIIRARLVIRGASDGAIVVDMKEMEKQMREEEE